MSERVTHGWISHVCIYREYRADAKSLQCVEGGRDAPSALSCLWRQGALTMLAKALAMEWADQGILVSSFHI